MSLTNIAYNAVLTWANPTTTQLELPALVPLFGERPIELGMAGKEALLTRVYDGREILESVAALAR